MPPRFWGWAAIFIGAGVIVWWKLEEGEAQRLRNELLARQRAVVAELGPRWYPLRAKMEGWTEACARVPEAEDVVEREALAAWPFRKLAGIYLRLGRASAETVDKVREAANKSLHDGFTACLMLVSNPSPLEGAECRTAEDCPAGHWCNEFSRCARHSQPFNLRLAYKTLHVMSDEWVKDVQTATKKLTLRGAAASFDAAHKYDLPVAIEMLTRARYFLVVIDEPPTAAEAAADEAVPAEPRDGGTGSDDGSIATAPHKARVCLWRLEDDRKMLSVRRDAAGVLMGGAEPLTLESRAARQRQANSCALALAVREALGDDKASKAP
jgi:hypothetical protein